MLFSVQIVPRPDSEEDGCDHYFERVVNAPPTKRIAGVDAVHDSLFDLATKWAREESVMWGFKPVEVTISRLFPMTVDKDGKITSEVRSVHMEWTEQVDRSENVQRLTAILEKAMKS